jgi:hypothetical protein
VATTTTTTSVTATTSTTKTAAPSGGAIVIHGDDRRSAESTYNDDVQERTNRPQRCRGDNGKSAADKENDRPKNADACITKVVQCDGDKEGSNREGSDREGSNREGSNREGSNRERIDREGIDRDESDREEESIRDDNDSDDNDREEGDQEGTPESLVKYTEPECGPWCAYMRYVVLMETVRSFSMKDKRALFKLLREGHATSAKGSCPTSGTSASAAGDTYVDDHTFLPRLGVTMGEFTVFYLLSSKSQMPQA